jgi:hypothetical protein
VTTFNTHALVVLTNPALATLFILFTTLTAMVDAGFASAAILSRVTFHPIAYAFYTTKFNTRVTNSGRI